MKRPLDNLGRIVIPSEIRETLDINIGDAIEFFVDNDILALRKYTSGCYFCDNIETTLYFKGKFLCAECTSNLKIGKKSLLRSAEETATTKEVLADHSKENRKWIRNKTEIMVKEYLRLSESMPNLKQREIAEIMGVKQGRISQLKKAAEEMGQRQNEDELLIEIKNQYAQEQALNGIDLSKDKRKKELIYIIQKLIERVPSLTQHEIASKVNVSQSRVSQILKIIKKQLKSN